MNGDAKTKNQPAFCPICGLDVRRFAGVGRHLHISHHLEGRDRTRVRTVVWREVVCALLEISPGWDGP